MIFVPSSDSELALPELGRGLDFNLGMLNPWLWLGCPVMVRGQTRAVSRSQVHRAGVLAGTAAVVSQPSSPARAVAGGGTIRVLKRLVFYLPV